MAGYYGYSKSNNAISAEQEGKFPRSKVAKKLGIPSAWILENVKTNEYHHTSCKYNTTYYYDLEDVISIWINSGNKPTKKMLPFPVCKLSEELYYMFENFAAAAATPALIKYSQKRQDEINKARRDSEQRSQLRKDFAANYLAEFPIDIEKLKEEMELLVSQCNGNSREIKKIRSRRRKMHGVIRNLANREAYTAFPII